MADKTYQVKIGSTSFDEKTAFTMAVILLQVNPASEKSGVSRLDYSRQVLPSMEAIGKAYAGQVVEVSETEGEVRRIAKLNAENLKPATESVINALSARDIFESVVTHITEGTASRGAPKKSQEAVLNIPLPTAKK